MKKMLLDPRKLFVPLLVTMLTTPPWKPLYSADAPMPVTATYSK